jgi:prophage regulatory protein
MRVLDFEDLKPEKGIPYSKTHLMRLIKAGRFPPPIHLGGRLCSWVEHEIDAHIEAKIAERDANRA